MALPGRNYQSSTNYRYGFNGKENDKETSSGAQDFGMRQYDNRLGRFFSVDPFTKLVFNKTPYCFAGNSPIAFIDKNGGFQIPPALAKTYPELNNIAVHLPHTNRSKTLKFQRITPEKGFFVGFSGVIVFSIFLKIAHKGFEGIFIPVLKPFQIF